MSGFQYSSVATTSHDYPSKPKMFWLQLVRIAFMGWAAFCAILLLGFGAHVLSSVGDLGLPSFAWAGLAVATAVLTLISLPTMVVIDFLRTGAFTSMIVVEISWLSFLGVLFLATGGAAAANAADFWVQCNVWSPAAARSLCNETSAAAAFGFLGWLPLWTYTGALLVYLIMHAQRGNYIYQRSLKEANLGAGIPPPGPNATLAAAPGAFENKPSLVGYPPSSVSTPQPYPQV